MRTGVAPAEQRATKEGLYIPSLDGIRAASVALVFAAHAGLKDRVPGNFGVTVFFFLSGYLITTLLRMERERNGRISLRNFYLRRVLRIFPPFYLVLVLATLLTVVGALPGPRITPDALLSQVFYLTNYRVIQHGWWDGIAPGTWIFWSLSVEEYFYLGFPLLYLALLRWLPGRRRQALVLVGLCAAVLAWRAVLVFALGASKDRTYIATDTRIDSILFGCILGLFGNPILDPTKVRERTWKLALVPLALAGLLVSFLVRSPQFQETVRYSLQGVCLFPLFVTAVRWPGWLPMRVLNVGWVKFLGVLSYSIYLVHPAVLWGVTSWIKLPGVAQAAIGLALTLAIALAIYEVVEKPAARLRRRLSRVSPEPRPSTASAPARTEPRGASGTQGAQAAQPGGAKP
jgi:peptidoglycan/LPS O-acetylase OafA/YrhL